MPLQAGLVINFKNTEGIDIAGIVINLESDTIIVDFNHPLADQSIIFNVEIMDVKIAI